MKKNALPMMTYDPINGLACRVCDSLDRLREELERQEMSRPAPWPTGRLLGLWAAAVLIALGLATAWTGLITWLVLRGGLSLMR